MSVNITAEISTSALLAAYNYFQRLNNGTEIKKFADRPTAEKRTKLVMNLMKPDERPQPFGPVDPATKVVAAEHPGARTTEAAEKAPLDFKTRPGTNLATVTDVLAANLGKFVPIVDLVTQVYGSKAKVEEKKGPLGMILKGVQKHIADHKLPVKLVKQKEGKSIAYGLIDA